MAKPESRLWHQLRTNLPDVHWTRIESWASQGVPDCNGCYRGKEFWVELKVSRSNRISLSPFQISWHLARNRVNGVTFILISDPGRRLLELYEGSKVRELRDIGRRVTPLLKLSSPYDWSKLLASLIKQHRRLSLLSCIVCRRPSTMVLEHCHNVQDPQDLDHGEDPQDLGVLDEIKYTKKKIKNNFTYKPSYSNMVG